MQPLAEIDDSYAVEDPWGYQTNPEDKTRKQAILDQLAVFPRFQNALDIGAGEGWITKDLPADKIYGFETSEKARARFPSNVEATIEPKGRFDLVTATGIMYSHYDTELFLRLIRDHASNIVLLCNIRDWEIPLFKDSQEVFKRLKLVERLSFEFPYREFVQKLRIFERF